MRNPPYFRRDSWGAAGLQIATALLVMVSLGQARAAHAAGVVGFGFPGSCTQTAFETALAGGGSVTFNCGAAAVTIPLVAGTGETISLDTTVDGGGLITIDSTISGFPVFNVDPGSTLTVENLTLVNANVFPDEIPVISNGGTLIATNCTFSDDSLAAIFTVSPCGLIMPCVPPGGIVTATDCTFLGQGGGLFEEGLTVPAASAVAGCTFANAGAGISTHAALAVTNSTFTGNTVGIVSLGTSPSTITNATFSGNGVAISGAASLTNSIVADSSTANCSGTITDNGHNLDDGSSCAFSAVGSLSATPAGLDPAGLQSNGGPTETIALQSTSAAVDGGDDTVCAASPVNGLDQRGFARPGTGHTHCSIGAYEFYAPAAPSPTPTATATDTPAVTPTDTRTVTPTPSDTPTVTPTPSDTPTQTPTDTPALPPLIKLQCMNGGWQTFITPRTFKNQGDCIRFVNTGK